MSNKTALQDLDLPTLIEIIEPAPAQGLSEADKQAVVQALLVRLAPEIDAAIANALDKQMVKSFNALNKELKKSVLQTIETAARQALRP